jgi:hypothetical protein
VTACICHRNVPSGREENSDLIDHRYFFQLDGGSGRYTCGLVRDAVGEQLLEWNIDFADTDFLASLAEFIDNKSIAGYLIEYAVLSSIKSNGLSLSAGLKKSMEVKLFTDMSDIDMDIMDRPVLYRPKKFNFEAIDGLIVLIKDSKPRKMLFMYALQITLVPATHRPSRVQFFKKYGQWITKISKFKVEVEFLWITPTCREIRGHPAGPKQCWPKHEERYIPFVEINKGIWEKYEDASRKLPHAAAAAAQAKLGPNPGVLDSEEFATQEPATQEPTTEEPATQEPATQEPATKKRATKKPASKGATGAGATKGARAAPTVSTRDTRAKAKAAKADA